jgi:hypothetical protein
VRAEAIVGLLAEPQRMQVFAALVLGAGTADRVREVTGLDGRTVATALRKLESGGLVEEAEDKGYRPVTDVFREAARSAAPPVERHGYADERVETVVRTFVRDGRLIGVPAQLGRRRVLLEHVVQSFEPGRDYAEKEVNAVLQAWAAGGPVDHVSLRRYLVDEGLLTRGGAGSNKYRRSGGWLDVLGDQPQESLGTQGD